MENEALSTEGGNSPRLLNTGLGPSQKSNGILGDSLSLFLRRSLSALPPAGGLAECALQTRMLSDEKVRRCLTDSARPSAAPAASAPSFRLEALARRLSAFRLDVSPASSSFKLSGAGVALLPEKLSLRSRRGPWPARDDDVRSPVSNASTLAYSAPGSSASSKPAILKPWRNSSGNRGETYSCVSSPGTPRSSSESRESPVTEAG